VCRQTHHFRGIDGAGKLASGLEHGFQALGGLVVGHHHDDRLACGTRHERDIDRAGSRSEARHTSPPRGEAEMPANALEARRVLQLRKDFADERENHEVLV
jgi:hypothetical protein